MKFPLEDNHEIYAVGRRYLCKQRPQEELYKGLLVLPDSAKERSQIESTVMEYGTAKLNDPAWIPAANIGDRVMHASHAGTPILIQGERWLTLPEEAILAVIKKGDDTK